MNPHTLRPGDRAAYVDTDGEGWTGRVELVDSNHIYSAGTWHQIDYGGLPDFRTWYAPDAYPEDADERRMTLTPASQIKSRARTWDCRRCGRTLRASEMHIAHQDAPTAPFCTDCSNGYPQSLEVHRTAFPDCPEHWHDAWDHSPALCTDRRTFTAYVRQHQRRALEDQQTSNPQEAS